MIFAHSVKNRENKSLYIFFKFPAFFLLVNKTENFTFFLSIDGGEASSQVFSSKWPIKIVKRTKTDESQRKLLKRKSSRRKSVNMATTKTNASFQNLLKPKSNFKIQNNGFFKLSINWGTILWLQWTFRPKWIFVMERSQGEQ